VPVDNLFRQRSRDELKKQWLQKKKFCCIVVSNGASKKRIDFFKKLDRIKAVDSGGKVLNNVGGPVKSKIEFIKDYRFVIAFENSSHPGYITEKILEPILTDSIPLYWGSPNADLDFNEKRFLNYHSFANEDEFINAIMELENNPEKAIDMITAPPFPRGFEKPEYISDERLLQFLHTVIRKLPVDKPVAQTYRRHLHKLTLKRQALFYSFKYRMAKTFK
jgi:alpha(1,3/1,4) fucosyltransferase